MIARAPRSAAPARIAPLATLPVFFKLAGRKAVLAGDSEGALWKAELLAATGAEVHAFAPDDPAIFAELLARLPAGRLRIEARAWRPQDLDGAAIAIADLDDTAEAEAFVAAARAAGAAANIIDKPEFCAFQFGAIVNRSPLVIGISTDGAAPVFGQAIRARIEAMLPGGLKAWAEAARDWRPLIQARRLGFAARRHFWEMFTARALAGPERPPAAADRDGLIEALDRIGAEPSPGRVTLVGAGPGDPELLTLKALRMLQSADVILYDDLVSAQILELARREARRMLVGKKGYGPSCKQDEINALMVKLALQGKHVVRLKGGDPGVFGRAGEEIAACRAAGIAVTIVPGITAAQGAAAALGISLTERSTARRLQFVTGHSQDGQLPEDICWSAIADPGATTIIYMPSRTLGEFRDRALEAGLSPATPAIAIAAATRPEEQRIAATIAALPELLRATAPAGPVLVILGEVLRSVSRDMAGTARPLALAS